MPINNFKDLYNYVADKDAPIMVRDLIEQIRVHYWPVDDVSVIPISYPRPNRQAHFKWGEGDHIDKDSGEFRPAQIRYCDSLTELEPLRRFIVTKELMHVFDQEDAQINDRDKFVAFLHELQNIPLPLHASTAFQSEHDTRWMAALVLCPREARAPFKQLYDAGQIDDFDVANRFWLPESVIPSLMDDYYDTVYELMIET